MDKRDAVNKRKKKNMEKMPQEKEKIVRRETKRKRQNRNTTRKKKEKGKDEDGAEKMKNRETMPEKIIKKDNVKI